MNQNEFQQIVNKLDKTEKEYDITIDKLQNQLINESRSIIVSTKIENKVEKQKFSKILNTIDKINASKHKIKNTISSVKLAVSKITSPIKKQDINNLLNESWMTDIPKSIYYSLKKYITKIVEYILNTFVYPIKTLIYSVREFKDAQGYIRTVLFLIEYSLFYSLLMMCKLIVEVLFYIIFTLIFPEFFAEFLCCFCGLILYTLYVPMILNRPILGDYMSQYSNYFKPLQTLIKGSTDIFKIMNKIPKKISELLVSIQYLFKNRSFESFMNVIRSFIKITGMEKFVLYTMGIILKVILYFIDDQKDNSGDIIFEDMLLFNHEMDDLKYEYLT